MDSSHRAVPCRSKPPQGKIRWHTSARSITFWRIEIARAICAEIDGIAGASVQILSSIGKRVAEPQLVSIEVVREKEFGADATERIKAVVLSHLARIDELSERLIRGMLSFDRV